MMRAATDQKKRKKLKTIHQLPLQLYMTLHDLRQRTSAAVSSSQQLGKTMNELIKQIRKQINPPRKSVSETRDPSRSRVINGARRKENRLREAMRF